MSIANEYIRLTEKNIISGNLYDKVQWYVVSFESVEKDRALDTLKKMDPKIVVDKEGNPSKAWIKTSLPLRHIIRLHGVEDAIPSKEGMSKAKEFKEDVTEKVSKALTVINLLERIDVKCTFADGNEVITGFNGTIQDAKEYFEGTYFNMGKAVDNNVKCVKVEEI